MQKAAVDNEWEKYRTFQHGKRRKSKEKKEVIEQAQKEGRVVHLAALMDNVLHQKRGTTSKVPKTQRPCGIAWRRCARWLRLVRCIHRAGAFSVSHDGGISCRRHFQTTRMRRTSKSDAVSACTLVKMEGAPKLLKPLESELPIVWIRRSQSRWLKNFRTKIQDPGVPLERNVYGHPWWETRQWSW